MMKELKTILDWAFDYARREFSVIPIRGPHYTFGDTEEQKADNSKRPLLSSWVGFQKRRATEAEIIAWWKKWPKANIGIITGGISGITNVDLDSERAVEFAKENHFPTTPLVKTAKGYHCYYKYKEGSRNFQKRDDLPDIDLRSEGGYVVAPPSMHYSGKSYNWIEGKCLDDLPFAELPEIILINKPQDKTPLKDLYQGVPDGQRNDSLTRLVGSWVNDGLTSDECLQMAHQWNDRNNPPETDFKKIERTVRSIFEKHHRELDKEVEDTKALSEAIAEATTKNYHELLPELANLDSEIEKEILCKVLSKRIGVNYRTVRNEIKVYEQKKESIVTDTNIIIAHPSYHIDKGFLNLGFREVKVIGNNPEEQNFYVISDKDGIYINENRILQYGGKTIIFDERDRLLIKHEDRWNKNKILSFIKNPESPVGLYYEIKNILKQYIELPKDAAYGLLSSWIIASYFFLIFYAFPFLFIFGKKQSGKSRLLTLLERLCLNALKVKGVSVPSMVDSIDGVRGTFLNDQAESLSDNKNIELLGIITDSYTRGGGNRRIVDISNKKRRVLEFEAYSPKAFASIKEIDEDLKDRCIEITMLRAMKDYPEPEAFLLIWQDLRDKLYRLLLLKWHFAQEIYQDTGKGVTQRVRELWRPLETILTLEMVSIEEVQKIRAFFLESMLVTQSELSDNEIELFETLLMLLEDKGECVLTVSEIAREIKHDEGISEKGLQTWVGRTLRQFGLYDYQAGRKGKARAYKFSYDHIKDVLNRYTLTGSGFSGNVDETLDNQQSINDHLKNIGGIGGNTSGLDTTDQPPKTTEKNQVVNSKPLTDNGLDHLTTKTTSPQGEEVIDLSNVEILSWTTEY